MAKTHHYKIKDLIAADAAGTVYRAVDSSTGKRVALRKYTHLEHQGIGLHAVEEVAYMVAIGRLTPIRHPSLRRVLTGGVDPEDRTPYVVTRPLDADPLSMILRESRLAVDVATAMISQLLELCELLSQVLAEEGIWVETDVDSIAVTGDSYNTRFVFWASPLKCLDVGKKPRDFDPLVQLTETVMGWNGREIDEREGSHLYVWLQWLKEEAKHSGTTIREIREMLAAAAGVEPPPPIDSLLSESQRRRSWREKLPKLPGKDLIRAPKMPLFVILTVMLVVQSIAGWIWIRKINADFDEQLKQKFGVIDLSIPERQGGEQAPVDDAIEAQPTDQE